MLSATVVPVETTVTGSHFVAFTREALSVDHAVVLRLRLRISWPLIFPGSLAMRLTRLKFERIK